MGALACIAENLGRDGARGSFRQWRSRKELRDRVSARRTASTDYKQILDDKDVHVVLITSRNQQHAPQAIAALKAGKHVFVEKPMALTEKECRDLLDAREKSGKPAYGRASIGDSRRSTRL